MTYTPPYTISPKIFTLSQSIYHTLGVIAGEMLEVPSVTLRKQNNIKTIQASLAIEGNTLTLSQVTDIVEGKRVIGPPKDILEVKNALQVYEKLDQLNPLSIRDFLQAHKVLMEGLIDHPGVWRSTNVGVFNGSKVAHIAPPTHRVPSLMKSLFSYLKKEKDIPWLLKACIFHYELEFIHPFIDGNGRMGRLWQQALLAKESPVFKYIPVEAIIKESQEEYYMVLGQCDQKGNSTLFIEYALTQIMVALENYRNTTEKTSVNNSDSRLRYAYKALENHWFSRKQYHMLFKNISTATASRDLSLGVKQEILQIQGEKNQARYRFIRGLAI